MNKQTIRIAMCLLGLMAASQGSSADLTLPKEGWASWQVDAVEGAPDWCCWSSWDKQTGTRQTCQLDDDRGSRGNRDNSTTDAVRVYARVAGGRIERLRALSASCPAEAATPIRHLGNVATDDSARLLATLAKDDARGNDRDFGEHVLAALAMHRGDLAQNALVPLARDDARAETRKKAIFWLALLRGLVGADIANSAMFNDKDPHVRKHAAFSITLSKSPRIAAELIRQGNTDKDGDVRAQAWFWLAQTGAVESERAIAAAAKNDAADHVREQAIFALSRLPDERSTRALIAAAEDRSLSNEQRKRAVFWLGHSESETAQAYLEKVLIGKIRD
jgi:hypothetical protein